MKPSRHNLTIKGFFIAAWVVVFIGCGSKGGGKGGGGGTSSTSSTPTPSTAVSSGFVTSAGGGIYTGTGMVVHATLGEPTTPNKLTSAPQNLNTGVQSILNP